MFSSPDCFVSPYRVLAPALSNEKWNAVAAEVKKQCDAVDGLEDGLVNNPLACKFDVTKLACKPGFIKIQIGRTRTW